MKHKKNGRPAHQMQPPTCSCKLPLLPISHPRIMRSKPHQAWLAKRLHEEASINQGFDLERNILMATYRAAWSLLIHIQSLDEADSVAVHDVSFLLDTNDVDVKGYPNDPSVLNMHSWCQPKPPGILIAWHRMSLTAERLAKEASTRTSCCVQKPNGEAGELARIGMDGGLRLLLLLNLPPSAKRSGVALLLSSKSLTLYRCRPN
ncbi:hypothetical protein MUK42_30537 [Musa troglodytarum]|uniref:Uncharacterized protein n=1 Tax=Musa troglodytarum TaxID=320322 RepID=A0A9E7FF58_9LILI|nr:hypothetical protein MUK42_30537 [Musa troglodytarum]